MTISETCIRRPVLTTLVTASIIVLGIFAYRVLSVAALPAVDFPTISITATLPGASAETMAASVAAPIERQLSTIAGITSLTSSSSLGITTITIQFDLNRHIDGAALDVQTALSVAQRRLPVEMTTPPSFRKVNPGDFPVLYISLNSQTLPLSTVNEYGEITLAQQISQLPGVAQVLIYGAQKFAVRVQVDPVAAAARNISLEDIRTVVSKANSNTPVGTLNGPKQSVTLTASGAMTKAAEYRKVVVAYRNGSPVYLDQVARVLDSVENDKVASWFNDNRAVVLAIQRQPDANTVAVVDLVRSRLPQYRAQVPPSIRMDVLNDRSISIRESVADVQETLLIAIGLVIVVIFLFLRTISATIIPALAVPVSIIGTCAAMYVFGFSINNMTLLALTLSVGFVVDDAIVMLENIVRHIEGGMRPFEAALKGAREIGFTIVSITFSLIAVFIPVLLMGGMVGRVFREFAVSIAVAIIISGFVSLTLTPMLCARVLRPHREGERQNIVLRAFEAMFRGWLRAYEWSLDKVIAYKAVMLVVTFATLVATAWLYIIIPKGFFPIEDTGFISASTEASSDVSFGQMATLQRQVADIIRADKAVDYVNSTVGAGGPNPTLNSGRMFVALKPKKQRGESSTEVIQRLRRAANVVPGMRVTFQNVQNINITGRISKAEWQYTLQSSDTEALYRIAPELREKIAQIPGLTDVSTDLYIKNPQMAVEIDREKAAAYGITIDQIRQELFDAYGARQVGTIYTATNDYQVILESQPQFQTDTSQLAKIHVKTNTGGGAAAPTPGSGVNGNGVPSGQSIPLSAVTRMVPAVGPLQVNHQGNQPSVTLSFNLIPGYSLGYAVDAIRTIERESNLPITINTGFQGGAQVFQDSLKGQSVLVLAAIFAAYVVLG
ncbi:MAG: efflux RND transporter permease subunit, partial [Hyphomicrobiales bacterium]|nr:efflux RND transporter permease subunit [Hyphomicrobiales bacterium]